MTNQLPRVHEVEDHRNVTGRASHPPFGSPTASPGTSSRAAS
jgi:hypothetical protein